jgi:hypothetical protein
MDGLLGDAAKEVSTAYDNAYLTPGSGGFRDFVGYG